MKYSKIPEAKDSLSDHIEDAESINNRISQPEEIILLNQKQDSEDFFGGLEKIK